MSVNNDSGLEFPKPVVPEWVTKVEQEFIQHESTASWTDREKYLVGSTSVNGVGNDIDIVVVHNNLDYAAMVLEDAGWVLNTAEVYRGIESDGWFSARKGELNLLVSEEDVRDQWLVADEVCRLFVTFVGRPSTRDERVAFHRAVFRD